MNKYLLYPGCSLDSSARAYNQSLTAICEPIGLNLEVIQDWNCCGATEYIGISLTPAYALIGRNLALAQKQAAGTNTIVAPCSACYLNLAKADHFMAERPLLEENVNEALAAGGLHYDPGSMEIRHLLDVIIHDIGLDVIRSKVVRPLKGLRVAPYLGCMVPRPDYKHRWSDHERPNELDRLLEALGAEVIDFPLKTHCCGGHMTQIGPSTAFELIRRLLHDADMYHADLMATVCPMCQMNLDAYQNETNQYFHTNYHMPVIFFTQLMGLAFGMEPEAMGFGTELVDAHAALSHIGMETPTDPNAAAKKPKRTGLPMPQMPTPKESVR
jgi:heterodisulfide reductase subunit B2